MDGESRARKVKVIRTGFRGPQGTIPPEDRARFDTALEVSKTLGVAIAGVEAARSAAGHSADTASAAVAASGEFRAAAEQAAAAAATSAAGAGGAANVAAAHRTATETARDQAQLYLAQGSTAAKVANTIAEGRARAAVNETFGVLPGGSDNLARLTYFRKDSDTAQTMLLEPASRSDVTTNAAGIAREVSARSGLVRAVSDVEDVLFRVTDADGNTTPLELRASDGSFSDRMTREIVSRTRDLQSRDVEGVIWAPADTEGNLFWPAVRDSDGEPPEWVASMLARRLRPYLTDPATTVVDRWVHPIDGAVVPSKTDTAKLAIWGSSSAEYIGPQLAARVGAYGLSLFRGGKGGERAPQTAARHGSTPALLSFPNDTIPASGKVDVTSSNMPPLGFLRPFVGRVAGVEGTLSSTDTVISFTRTTAGAAVPVSGPQPFISTLGAQQRDANALLWIGKNSLTRGNAVQTVLDTTFRAFEWLAPMSKRCLVLGHFSNTNWTAGDQNDLDVKATNAGYAARYGDLYFDVAAWLASESVWSETGVTPTQNDRTAQANGLKPSSLSLDNDHLNTAANTALSKRIMDRLAALGWIKEKTE